MRKADYATLASIIRRMVATGRAGAAIEHQSDVSRAEFRAVYETAREIAQQFATRANVNAAEFLKACGLTP